MKLLIAYDGSQCAEAALDDLVRAGLPDTGEAAIVSAAEVWLPPPNGNGDAEIDPALERLVRKYRDKGEKALAEADRFAKHAQSRFTTLFPGWKVSSGATYGSPAWEILTAADNFRPDLIVVGSHGQTAVSRFILGSISQKVLTEAHCSVRVARGRVEVEPAPVRIVIGYDGSLGAVAAVDSVLERNWGPGTEVRLISATESVVPTAIGRFIPPVADWAADESKVEHELIEKMAETALGKLRDAGLKASVSIIEGKAKQILVHEAEQWHADCIFVGANAFGSRVERFLLGSTSAAIASRAHCSVEVVRKPSYPEKN